MPVLLPAALDLLHEVFEAAIVHILELAAREASAEGRSTVLGRDVYNAIKRCSAFSTYALLESRNGREYLAPPGRPVVSKEAVFRLGRVAGVRRYTRQRPGGSRRNRGEATMYQVLRIFISRRDRSGGGGDGDSGGGDGSGGGGDISAKDVNLALHRMGTAQWYPGGLS